MTTNVLHEQSMLAMAASAYLEGAVGNEQQLIVALIQGDQNFSRFTPTQAKEFADKFEVFAHLANDQSDLGTGWKSGLSATIFRSKTVDPGTGQFEYTLAIRGFEWHANQPDAETDTLAAREALRAGYALGQLDTLDRFVSQSLAGQDIQLNITGHGLGGHLATLYSELRPGRVRETHLFNAVGTGDADGTQLGVMLARYRAAMTDPYVALGKTAAEVETLLGDTSNKQNAWEGKVYKDLMQQFTSAASGRHQLAYMYGLTGVTLSSVPGLPGLVPLGSISGRSPNVWESVLLRDVRASAAVDSLPFGADPLAALDLLIRGIGMLHGREEPVWTESQSSLRPHGIALRLVQLATSAALGTVFPFPTNTAVNAIIWNKLKPWVQELSQLDLSLFGGYSAEQILLVDALAVGSLLHRVDPDLSQWEVNRILAAASPDAFDSLENTANAIARLLRPAGVAPARALLAGKEVPGPEDFADMDLRESLHALLAALDKTISDRGLGDRQMSLLPLGDPEDRAVSSAAVAELRLAFDSADGALRDRYALRQLNTFVIDAPAAVFEPFFADPGFQLYDSLNNPEGQLTTRELDDRERALKGLLIGGYQSDNVYSFGNQRIPPVVLDATIERPTTFLDVATGRTVAVVNDPIFRTPSPGFDFVAFGTDAEEETIKAKGADARIYGGGGKDFLHGGWGSDLLRGDTGDDKLHGGGGGDTLNGGPGEDWLYGDTSDLNGILAVFQAGGDVLVGGPGPDHLYGENGDDKLFGDLEPPSGEAVYWENEQIDGSDTLYGGDGEDKLYGGAGKDYLFGEAHHDEIWGGSGDDEIKGGNEFGRDGDTIYGGAGEDTIEGERGWDTIYGDFESPDVQQGAGGDKLIGGEANDKLYGGLGDDWLYGDFEGRDDTQQNGWDELWGHAGDDHLFGGRGDDKLYGGDGADRLEGGLGNDWLEGGAGNDYYVFTDALGVDTIVDSDGVGHIEYRGAPVNGGAKVGAGHWKSGNIHYFLADATPGGTLEIWLADQARIDVRNWQPGHLGITLEDTAPPPPSFDRTVLGDRAFVDPATRDDLGNYLIIPDSLSYAGDTLYDSPGNDQILPGRKAEHINAFRGGDDHIEFEFWDEEDTLPLSNFVDDWVLAGPGNDTVIAATGHDFVNGGAGDDHLYSREFREEDDARTLGETEAPVESGWEWLSGEGGDDVLVGHPGKDLLWGGKGDDRIYGGAGDDDIASDYTPVLQPSPYHDDFGEGFYHGTGMVIGVDRHVLQEADNLTVYQWTLTNFTTPDDTDPGKDIVYGGAGVDWIFGGGGGDYLDGGADGDVVFGEAGGDSIHGGDGDDVLNGDELGTLLAGDQHGGDELYGGKGADGLWGNGGDDRLFGGDDKDYLDGDDSTTDPEFHGFDYLEGGAGDDTLLGSGQGDVLFGEAGDDIMHGDTPKLDPAYAGGDYLFGGSGKDTMVGGAGDDELYGEEGDDQIDGDNGAETLAGEHHGTDYLSGGTGDDELRGGGKADHLYGGAGNDKLWGDADDVAEEFHGGDRLYGEDGDDQLVGDGNDDYLVGGPGLDYLEGGTGDDRYAFARGDSPLQFNAPIETLIDEPGANVIEFDFGIESQDLDVTTGADGVSLILRYSSDDALYISDGLNGTIAEFRFAGGSSLSLSDLLGQQLSTPVVVTVDQPDQTLLGSAGSDTFTATGGATVFHGGRGDDLMVGGGGANRYQIGLGDGRDRIVDTGGQRDAADQLLPNRLEFGAGIARADLRLSVGNGLVVKTGPEDEVVLATFDPTDAVGARTIDEFVFADSTTVSYEELVAQGFDIEGTAGADLLTGTNLVDRISGGQGADTLEAGAGDDTLEGGAGDDVLKGGVGNDVYRFAAGFGRDVIDNEDSGADRRDTIELDGISPIELALRRESDDLVVAVLDAEDSIRVSGFFVNDGANTRRIDEIRFGPGLEDFTLTLDEIKAAVLFGEAADDRLVGYGSDDLLYGREGADTLEGAGGEDYLDGGAGDDTLRGGTGGDTYAFFPGAGHDTIDEPTAEAGIDDTVEVSVFLPSETAVGLRGGDLVLTFTGGEDSITLRGGLAALGNGSSVERVRFVDAPDQASWTAADLLDRAGIVRGTDAVNFLNGTPGADALLGLGGNDSLRGQAGDDFLDGGDGADQLFGDAGDDFLRGGAGADRLTGGAGNDVYDPGPDDDVVVESGGRDTYRFARGFGRDRIEPAAETAPLADRIEFADIASGEATVAREGSDLVIRVPATGDELRVLSVASGSTEYALPDVQFTDVTWTAADFQARFLLATEGPDVITGLGSDDTIDGLGGNDTILGRDGHDVLSGGAGVDSLYGEAGDDTLTGGADNDTLVGGPGSDRFVFARGDGYDVIQDYDTTPGKLDTIAFAAGITPGEVRLTRVAGYLLDDLVVQVPNPAAGTGIDQITVKNAFLYFDNRAKIDQITFVDETTWSLADIKARLLATTDKDDFVVGYETDDVIDAKGGRNTVDGDQGDDRLLGGDGVDNLLGNAGDDRLEGGAGDDILMGDGFFHLRYSGYSPVPGDDTLLGGPGDDVLDGGGGRDDLDGGAGDDDLRGGAGDDTYRWARGQGSDRLRDDSGTASGGNDRLLLGAEVLPAAVTLYRTSDGGGAGDDLVLIIDGSPDQQLRLVDFFNTARDNRIEQIVLGDSTVWTGPDIEARVIGSGGTANTMTGTAGDDLFAVDHPQDVISEAAGQGTDTVQSSVGYVLPANVERLELTGVLNIDGLGNALNNTIVGNTGNNVLDGGEGADTLIGGQGNDGYRVGYYWQYGEAPDTVIEAPGEGEDTAFVSSQAYRLPENVENLVVHDNTYVVRRAVGNALDNSLSVEFTASFEEVELDGGPGADRMIGNYSLDTYVVDNPGDVVIEEAVYANGSQGSIDTVRSAIDYVLGANLENLELQQGSGALVGTGNALNNSLAGNANANTLTGLDGDDTLFGAAGADTLIGGRGNDTYVLAHHRFLQGGQYIYTDGLGGINEDTITELAGEGIDTVKSLFDYTLGDDFENLELLSYTGGGLIVPVQATGNAVANRITGNVGNNVIDGRGGADVMDGGSGNDTYYVDDVGDVVVESEFAGADDTVISQVSYALGTAVENLTLVGESAISGTGNELNNRLDGAQSAVANTLAGGLGDDTYVLGAGDVAVENAGEGIDTVVTSESYTLGQGVENLTLTGTLATTGTGDSADNVLDGSQNSAANTLIGGLGDDTYVVDGSDLIVENPDEGIDTVVGTFDYTLAANLENLTLRDGALNGTGNAGDNVLTGNALDNVLDGAAGADILRGIYGNDTYVIDDLGDTIDETDPFWGGDTWGIDTVRSSISYALANDLENLVLIGDAATSGTGNAFNNTLDGSESVAANTLIGGLGDDIYVVDGLDAVIENAEEGNDTVQSASTYALPTNVEALILTGTAAIDGVGNESANTLTGNAAANTLDGGAGADTMSGGAGDDTYVVDESGDVVTETANEGVDTVLSSMTRTLPNNVENLTLTGTAAINGTGNSLANVLSGNSAANTLAGRQGNDSYYVSTGDTVTESSSQGTDTVYADVTWTLGSNLENLTLIGTDNINATGNSAANVITGNAGNNTLSGGTGADQMAGGAGDDTYVVDNTGDTVVENPDGGADLVQSSVTYTLAAEVENLTLTGSSGRSGTGNALNNTLTGNSGNNTLTGNGGDDWLDGGSGSDTMRGGTGDDTYVVAQSGDVVTENADEGTDTVRTSITYTLGSNVENVILTGTAAINGTGNTLANTLIGNSANNTLTGNAGADTLDGGAGSDTLTGGTGNDTYRLGRGSGADTIVENDTTAGNADIAQFLAGVAHDQVWFLRSGNNLEARVIGTGDKFILSNWYSGSQYRVEQFGTVDDARTLLEANVQKLVDAMASFAPPPMGQTTLPPDYQQSLAAVIAANWQ